MKRYFLLISLEVAFVACLIPHAGAENRRALLVGIGNYEARGIAPAGQQHVDPATGAIPGDQRQSRGAWSNLPGPATDVRIMREILVSCYGFSSHNVRTLVDSEATRKAILTSFREHLIEPVSPGDVCVFYYAGHGSQVRNSRSTEPDGKDETLVPADARLGAWDIRDKELASLFNDVIDRRGVLTVLLDSCHSGSVGRGVVPGPARAIPPDMRDVAAFVGDEETDSRAAPETRQGGAIIVSATQDDQLAYEARDENGVAHGAFSLALSKALREGMGHPAHSIYQRVKALIETEGICQDPVLAGPRERLLGPLFGGVSDAVAGGTTVAVLEAEKKGSLILEGGQAVGLTPGSELVKVGSDTREIRVRVEALKGWNRAEAKVVSGKRSRIGKGDLLRLDRWVAPGGGGIRVWLPGQSPSWEDVLQVRREVASLQKAGGIECVEDPTENPPSHELAWNGAEWQILAPKGNTIGLGPRPQAEDIRSALSGPADLFVNLPPPRDVIRGVGPIGTDKKGMVCLVQDLSDANYRLMGRVHSGAVEYAWVRPSATAARRKASAMPARTDWMPCPDGAQGRETLGKRLSNATFGLAKINAWMVLTPPSDTGYFPYGLALKHESTGRILTEGALTAGDKYRVVLVNENDKSKRVVERRYVYAFVLDSHGNSTLLFPRAGQGSVENRVPYAAVAGGSRPREIPLGSAFQAAPPYGTDTYVLLTTKEAIPAPSVLFHSSGVRTRGEESVSFEDSPLAEMLSQVGTRTRGGGVKVGSGRWSLDRLSFRTVPR